MDFELTPAQRAWRDEVREFLARHVTAALREELIISGNQQDGPELTEFRRQVSAKGWYGLNWPTEYGGLGRSAVDQHILVDEFGYAGVPGLDLTITSVGPMIMKFGTEQNRKEWLPGISNGQIRVAVGYSEPNAGTDLASLKTQAVLDGEEWVINGSKIWNSWAHTATHEWLCVRTDPEAPKHSGISVIIVPIDTPGVDVQPLWAWSGRRTNQTFFTDVRVPATNLIGDINRGWSYITGALVLERGAVAHTGDLRWIVDELVRFCRSTEVDGELLADRPEVQTKLANLVADVEVARLHGLEAASLVEDGIFPTHTSTELKVFSSELRQRIADWATQILGMYGQLRRGDPLAPIGGRIELLYREAPLLRFGGGTNEVLRDAIAHRGHGLPRS